MHPSRNVCHWHYNWMYADGITPSSSVGNDVSNTLASEVVCSQRLLSRTKKYLLARYLQSKHSAIIYFAVFFLSSSVVAMATSSTGIVSENDANDCAVKDF